MNDGVLQKILQRLGRAEPVPSTETKAMPEKVPLKEADVPPKETLHQVMEQDLKAFIKWAAVVYEELPTKVRMDLLRRLQPLYERMDLAYREADWGNFQGAMTEAKTVVSEAQRGQATQEPREKHWIYQVWSRVLDAEVWFVCCDEEVTQLIQRGISRGAIYTRAELTELVTLPLARPQDLKKFHHLVKSYFDASIVSRKGGTQETSSGGGHDMARFGQDTTKGG